MYVIATAGHVDHGKSTLVERLSGMWPDRLAEEQRRGLTIDLGFAWTSIQGRTFAFVDVLGPTPSELLREILSRTTGEIDNLEVRTPSLEDVYLELLQAHDNNSAVSADLKEGENA